MVVLADRMVKRSGWADCLNLSRSVLCLGETELPRLTASYRLFFEETYLVVQSVLRLKHELLAVNAHLIGSLGVDVVQTELFHTAMALVRWRSAQRCFTSFCQSCCRCCAALSQFIACSRVLFLSIQVSN